MMLAQKMFIVSWLVATACWAADTFPQPEIQEALQAGARAEAAPIDVQFVDLTRSHTARDLLVELLYFSAHARDTRSAAYAAAMQRKLQLTRTARVAILVEYLDAGDPVFQSTLRGVLADYEGRHGNRRPDFSIYRELLAAPLRADQQLPTQLVDYLYEQDAGQAMLLMMRVHRVRAPQQIQQLRWAEHLRQTYRWRMDNGFEDRAEQLRTQLRTELDLLAADETWWIQRYVAIASKQL